MNFDKRFSIEQFEPTVSQSPVPSHALKDAAAAAAALPLAQAGSGQPGPAVSPASDLARLSGEGSDEGEEEEEEEESYWWEEDEEEESLEEASTRSARRVLFGK